MKPYTPIVLSTVLSMLLLISGCDSANQSEANRSDPSSRIMFAVPDEWTEVPGSNGTRFRAPDLPPGGVVIQVNTVENSPRSTLEQQRDVWLAAQERAGGEILSSGDWQQPGFQGVEYVHTAESVHGDVIWHHIQMNGQDFRVVTHLMASDKYYDTYKPVYFSIVKSIQAKESE